MDAEKAEWVERACLRRLAEMGSNGLSETVLCAVVTKASEGEDHAVIAPDVRRALKRLKENKRVAHSAGRWRRLA